MKFGIGQAAARLEDVRLLTGRGCYVDDLRLDGQAHAAVLRSPVAHGRIVTLDPGPAREVPGLLSVWTHADIDGRLAPLRSEAPIRPAPVTVPRLADEVVRFVGQPVVFAVAETAAAARDALEAIEVDYAELPAVTDPVAALAEGAPQLHPDAPGNLAYDWELGDRAATEGAFARAAHVVRVETKAQRLVVASLEPRGINVRWQPEEGRWEAWIGSQSAHNARAKLAHALGVEPDRIRVHTPDVGGAFGMKLMDHPEYALAALAARDLGRPVKWVGDRSESFLSDAQARDLTLRAEAAFDADGRCLAMRMDNVSNLGAQYSSMGAAIHTVFSAGLLGGMYGIEAMHARVRGAFTNTTSTDAYRGAGRPESLNITELLMERAARELGRDRVELRRQNLLRPEDVPHRTPGGLTFDSLDPARNIDRVLAAADWDGFAARAAAAPPRALRGIAMAYFFERTGGKPMEMTRISLEPDGSVRVWIGTQSTGQGHETAWAQIVHEITGLPFGRIVVQAGDSDALRLGGGTGGSRSAVYAGMVLGRAGEALIDRARPLASRHLEAAEADIEFSAAEGGRFRIVGTDRSVGLAELAAEAGGLAAEGEVGPDSGGGVTTFPNGAHVAEVEIDRETGGMRLVAYTACDDFGRVINPLLLDGQRHGGIAMGAGQAIGEGMVWDPETGQPLTASFMDYFVPRAGDLPFFQLFQEGNPAPSTPLGVKGCGEAGTVASIPTVTLAVFDALHRAGAGPVETPLTPARLWQALRDV